MKFSLSMMLRAVLSFLIGLPLAFAFASPYFGDKTYTLLDKFSLVAVPAAALTFVAYYLLSLAKWEQVSFKTIDYFRLLSGWLFACVVSFFVTGFLANFYTDLYQIALLAMLSQLVFGAFFYFVIGRIRRFMQEDLTAFGITLILFALLPVFQVMIFRMGSQFPKLFDPGFFLLEGKEFVLFLVVGIISLPWLAWTLHRLQEPALYQSLIRNKFIVFVRGNLSGLSLSSLFFGLYVLIGSVLNFSSFDVDDIFFDADGFIWRYRLTTDHWQDFYWRSVHPLALLILKPSVNLISVVLHGNLHFAAVTLAAGAGASCVFLAWMLMKDVLQDDLSALLMAFLLGISTSHLIFGSLIETYIFLAVATLFLFVLLQKGSQSLPLLVSVGVVTMGITLTNFAQTVIALFGARPSAKFIIKYVFLVVTLVISLTLVSNLFYPNASPYFFAPSSFLAEQQNVRTVSVNRGQALVRAFLFNNIVAPTPLLSHKDITFTQFRFYRAEDGKISEYGSPLQAFAGWTWALLLAVAAIFLVKDFKSHNMRLIFSLLGCIAFNLLLHLSYGKELFLYSPNWTYAIVLLTGISWKNLLTRKWFQILLIAFFLLLILNNSALIYTIMEKSVPYIY